MDSFGTEGTDLAGVQEQVKSFTLLSNSTLQHEPIRPDIIVALCQEYHRQV